MSTQIIIQLQVDKIVPADSIEKIMNNLDRYDGENIHQTVLREFVFHFYKTRFLNDDDERSIQKLTNTATKLGHAILDQNWEHGFKHS